MFRDIPGCSRMFHVPGFIDGLYKRIYKRIKFLFLLSLSVMYFSRLCCLYSGSLLCISQFQLRPSHPPGNCGAFARIVSPGGRALAYPRATPGLLTHTWFLTRNPNEDDFIGKDQ